MICSLHLKNFQGHTDSLLYFDPHFNCIVGTGNAGKTSVVRALGLLFYNHWDKSWVTFGATHCEVTATYIDGTVFERKKGPKINEYIVTLPGGLPQKFENFGTTIPEDIANALGVRAVELPGGDRIQLNLHTQFGGSLLQSVNSANKGRLFGKLSGLDLLDAVSQDVASDKKLTQVVTKTKEEELLLVSQRLLAFQGLPGLRQTVNNLASDLVLVEQQSQRLQQLQLLQNRIRQWERTYQELLPKVSKHAVIDPSSTSPVEQELTRVQQLRQLQSQIRVWKSRYSQVRQLVGQVDASLILARHQYTEALRESHTCPTCKTSITPECLRSIIGDV